MEILIVDDDPITCTKLQEVVRKLGHTASCVSSPAAAMNKIARVDVLLLDWMMPDTDGIALTKKLRSLGYNTYIIMISEHDDYAAVVDAIDAGANSFLLKPVNPRMIDARLRMAEIQLGFEGQTRAY